MTPKEKAKEYADSLRVSDSNLTQKQIEEYAITDFLAGYKAAQEWISVEDELPENETPLIAKNNYGGDTNYNYIFYETTEERDFKCRYTHWRPIEIK